jgi:glycosyltransferase involved in cell wall biosynthesis
MGDRHRLPAIVAPHGSLHRAVVRKSWWKKRLALWAYESVNLERATCLHATAQTEIGDFREYGLNNPVAVLTNGISDAWLQRKGDSARFRATCGIPPDRRILLFLSRIAPKKGLPMLLEALSRLVDLSTDWVLVIVGADEDGHKAEVELVAARLGLTPRVKFVGPRFGQDKLDAFAAAELLVLPSISEGFPMVVLEALGSGVPAIVTHASAWKDLETYGCGWWVDITIEGIERALSAAFTLPPARLREMGSAGRRLVASRYNWSSIGENTLELYRWLIQGGDRPAFVSVSAAEVTA